MGIAFLIIFIFAFGICALLLWLLSVHNRLGNARAAAQLALSRLETESMRRGEYIGRLVEAARVFMHSQREVLDGVLVARNMLVTAIGNAVASPSQSKWFFLWFEGELELERALKRLQIAAADFSEFRSAQNILQLGGELDRTSERVDLFGTLTTRLLEVSTNSGTGWCLDCLLGFWGMMRCRYWNLRKRFSRVRCYSRGLLVLKR